MPDTKSLLIFEAVLRHGSMNAAARAIGITAPAVSQHIRQLEDHYRLRLLHRTTRHLEPTEAGSLLLAKAQAISLLLDQTEDLMGSYKDVPSGSLCLSMPSGLITLPAIQEFSRQIRVRYPNIRLTLLPDDANIDLQHEQVDIAIRAGDAYFSGTYLVARRLCEWQLYICASPDYLAVAPPIVVPADLLVQEWINHQSTPLLSAFSDLGLPQQLPEKRIECPLVYASRNFTLAGMGLSLQLSGDVQPYLEQGALEVVLPSYFLSKRTLYAVTAYRQQSAKTEVALQLLRQCFGAGDEKL